MEALTLIRDIESYGRRCSDSQRWQRTLTALRYALEQIVARRFVAGWGVSANIDGLFLGQVLRTYGFTIRVRPWNDDKGRPQGLWLQLSPLLPPRSLPIENKEVSFLFPPTLPAQRCSSLSTYPPLPPQSHSVAL